MKISVAIVFLAFLSGEVLAVAQDITTNSNDRPLLSGSDLSGLGKKGYVPLWLNRTKLGSSHIFQSTAGDVGIGTASPAATLDVNGAVNAATSFNLGGIAFAFGSASNLNALLGFAGNATLTGSGNTASGFQALYSITTGSGNTASGAEALHFNTTGNSNTASGVTALRLNTTGCCNTASGGSALQSNTTGSYNTASGNAALLFNTTGDYNTASGPFALFSNTTGPDNTASGVQALYSNTTGYGNTASGVNALSSSTSGGNNTAIGAGALSYNTTGSSNTALGVNAGPDSGSPDLTNATAIGAYAVVSESNALVLGGTGPNAVNVGIGTATPSNVLTIAQGGGQAISDGWTTYSSRRWKTNIQTLHGALGKVEQLRGVSYDLTANGKHEVGVIAEEVGMVVPEAVTWDKNGQDAQGVDYNRLTALLIEATKEQQALIRKQEEQIRTQQTQIRRLVSQVKAIRTSLKTNGRTDAEIRTAEVHLPSAVR